MRRSAADLVALVVSVVGVPRCFSRRRRPRPPKPGVKAVQLPMSMIVPDAEYPDAGRSRLACRWREPGVGQQPPVRPRRADGSRHGADRGDGAGEDPCSGLAVAAGTLWAPSCVEGVIYRIDTVTNQVVVESAGGAPPTTKGASPTAPTRSGCRPTRATRSRASTPSSSDILATIPVPRLARSPPSTATGCVWVSSTETSVVSVVHPASNKVIAEIPVDKRPRFMSAGEGCVWTLNRGARQRSARSIRRR